MIRRALGIGALVAALSLVGCKGKAYDAATELVPKPYHEYNVHIDNTSFRLQRFDSGFQLDVTEYSSDEVYRTISGISFQTDADGDIECVRDWYQRFAHTANSKYEKPDSYNNNDCDFSREKRKKWERTFLGYLAQLRDHKN